MWVVAPLRTKESAMDWNALGNFTRFISTRLGVRPGGYTPKRLKLTDEDLARDLGHRRRSPRGRLSELPTTGFKGIEQHRKDDLERVRATSPNGSGADAAGIAADARRLRGRRKPSSDRT